MAQMLTSWGLGLGGYMRREGMAAGASLHIDGVVIKVLD